MTLKIKKGDVIKIIKWDFYRAEWFSEEERRKEHEVIRKGTNRNHRRPNEYVIIRIATPERTFSPTSLVQIPLKNIIKINGKIMDMKKEVMGEKRNG